MIQDCSMTMTRDLPYFEHQGVLWPRYTVFTGVLILLVGGPPWRGRGQAAASCSTISTIFVAVQPATVPDRDNDRPFLAQELHTQQADFEAFRDVHRCMSSALTTTEIDRFYYHWKWPTAETARQNQNHGKLPGAKLGSACLSSPI